MPSFALITEGVTDQAVLEILLQTRYGPDVDIVIVQPERDASDRTRLGTMGGWEQVLAHCDAQTISDHLSVNDYLVIQIDTDIAEHPRFGVALTTGGKDRPVAQLREEVIQRLLHGLDQELRQQVEHRIIFAIAIHSIECWLLPIYASHKHVKEKIKQCEKTLEASLQRANLAYNKTYREYCAYAKPLRKEKQVEICCQANQSLATFWQSLPQT